MKCRVCRERAVIDLRRHNANFCQDHFLKYCTQQVERAIHDYAMLRPGERALVAVSGGKDSLAIWDILLELGYEVDGLYVGLGIGQYSDTSGAFARDFAAQRQAKLIEIDLQNDYGYDVPTAAAATNRVPCSACGLSKRHLFDRAALDGSYDVLITGHNLDDEAAVLYGNVLRWQADYLSRQRPMLAAAQGFPRKAKPLVRLTERETAAYCVLRSIHYLVDECPMAAGNKHLSYKNALNELEVQSPGSKSEFYFGFVDRIVDRLEPRASSKKFDDSLNSCARCSSSCEGEICAFCRLVERSTGIDPVPVELLPTRITNKRGKRPTKAGS